MKQLFLLLMLGSGCAAVRPAPFVGIAFEQIIGPDSRRIPGAGGPRTWVFTADGAGEVIGLPRAPFHAGSLGHGESRPALSPRGRTLAYAAADSVFLFDIRASAERVVHSGPANYLALITGWSPSGAHLLFWVGQRRSIYREDYPMRGFWILDSETGAVTRSRIPVDAQIHGWLDERTVLARYGSRDAFVTYNIFNGEQDSTAVVLRDRNHVHVVPRSNDVLAVRGGDGAIVRIAMSTGQEQEIVAPGPVGTWAGRPRLSPTGRRMAYTYWDGSGHRLMVDGEPVTETIDNNIRFQWLNDRSILVSSVGQTPSVVRIDSDGVAGSQGTEQPN